MNRLVRKVVLLGISVRSFFAEVKYKTVVERRPPKLVLVTEWSSTGYAAVNNLKIGWDPFLAVWQP